MPRSKETSENKPKVIDHSSSESESSSDELKPTQTNNWMMETVVSSKQLRQDYQPDSKPKKIYTKPSIATSSESESSDSESEKPNREISKKNPNDWMMKRINPYELEAQIEYEKNTPLTMRTLLARDFEKLNLHPKHNSSDEENDAADKESKHTKSRSKQPHTKSPHSKIKEDKHSKKDNARKVRFAKKEEQKIITGNTYIGAPSELIVNHSSSAFFQPEEKAKHKKAATAKPSFDATKTTFDATKTHKSHK